jgi:tetratricopeptide (TPR) repeat protein
VSDALGKKKLAKEQFELCVAQREYSGLNVNYYYKALCLEKLGRETEATEIYDGLIALGKSRLQTSEADFFAKFGERETPDDKLSNAYYLIGLGYMGKEMNKDATRMFSEAVSLNINHVWAAKFLSQSKK